MLLIVAIAILGVVVIVGTVLAGQYLLMEKPLAGLRWPGAVHGAGGLAGFAILVAALSRGTPGAHAVRMGAGAFGILSGGIIAAALVAGLTILAAHLRHRTIPMALVATHGMLAITGYTLLVTYLTMLR